VAKPAKKRAPGTSARVIPKSGHSTGTDHRTPPPSARYTPPIPRELKVSPWWVPALMGVLLVLGVAVILLNYVGLLPTWGFLPDDTSNGWLLVGLGFVLAGIVVATRWH